MKKLLLATIVFVAVALQVAARSITPVEAAEAAKSVLIRNGISEKFSVLNHFSIIIGLDTNTLAYVFPYKPDGFAVVSAEMELPPVLYYTFEGSFNGEGHCEDLIKFLIADVRTRFAQVALLPEKMLNARRDAWDRIIHYEVTDAGFEQWPPSGSTPTGGWLMENWHQNSPYNIFCPMDPVSGSRSVAGCPATAMAMIVNYFETVNGTLFTDEDDYYHSYSGRTYWIDDDYEEHKFLCFPDINAHFDTLYTAWANNGAVKNPQKAALTFACGVAAKQVYTSSVSGTFGVDQAYDAYLGFGFSQCELLFDADTSLYSKLSQNMKDAIPAHLAVVDPGWTMGHNVVVDGYNTDDFYHINFGWGGTYNGWYLVPDEIPYGLTVIEGVVLNIFEISTTVPGSYAGEDDILRVYPNPAEKFLMIDVGMEADHELTVTIFNSSGKLIETIKRVSGMEPLRIRLDGKYAPGVYYCSTTCGNRQAAKAFIVK